MVDIKNDIKEYESRVLFVTISTDPYDDVVKKYTDITKYLYELDENGRIKKDEDGKFIKTNNNIIISEVPVKTGNNKTIPIYRFSVVNKETGETVIDDNGNPLIHNVKPQDFDVIRIYDVPITDGKFSQNTLDNLVYNRPDMEAGKITPAFAREYSQYLSDPIANKIEEVKLQTASKEHDVKAVLSFYDFSYELKRGKGKATDFLFECSITTTNFNDEKIETTFYFDDIGENTHGYKVTDLLARAAKKGNVDDALDPNSELSRKLARAAIRSGEHYSKDEAEKLVGLAKKLVDPTLFIVPSSTGVINYRVLEKVVKEFGTSDSGNLTPSPTGLKHNHGWMKD
jgi:hypothetical protein